MGESECVCVWAHVTRRCHSSPHWANNRQPMYIDSSWGGDPYSDQVMALSLRTHVEPMLISAKVDLAIWGHHQYVAVLWVRQSPLVSVYMR